jgi:hypothetical protein
MTALFFDREDHGNCLNGTVVHDKGQLFQALKTLQDRPPFDFELVSDKGFRLLIGMGKQGCAQYSRRDREPPYMMAVDQGKEREKGYIEFLDGGTPSPVSKYYCMPFDIVREIAGYFVETGRMYPAVAWEEFDPKTLAD